MEEVIKAENLTKAYGTLLAADHISLWVKRGTAFGLLGANGAGKSTVIECILGVKQPDGGTVSVLSLDPRKDRRLFQQVGVQFQECGYQPEIKVSELCEEAACLYKAPGGWRRPVRKVRARRQNRGSCQELVRRADGPAFLKSKTPTWIYLASVFRDL